LPDGSAAQDLAQALPLYQDIAGPEISQAEIKSYADREIPAGGAPKARQNTKDIFKKLAHAIGIRDIPKKINNIHIIQAIANASPQGFRFMVQNQGRRFDKADIEAFKRAAGFA